MIFCSCSVANHRMLKSTRKGTNNNTIMIDIITNEIKKAMLAKDKVRLEALRAIKKELLEAKTAKGAGDELTEATTIALLQKMVKLYHTESSRFGRTGDCANGSDPRVSTVTTFAERIGIRRETYYRGNRSLFAQRNGESDGCCLQTTCREGRRKRYL